MGEVIKFPNKPNESWWLDESDPISNPEEERRFASLQEYLRDMTVKDALEFEGESKRKDMYAPRDLAKIFYDEVATVSPAVVEKIAMEEIVRHLGRLGQKVSDDERRAINNDLQFAVFGNCVWDASAGIAMIDKDPTMSRRVKNAYRQIRERKKELTREALGAEYADIIDRLFLRMSEGWKKGGWKEDLAKKVENIQPHKGLLGPVEFLEKAERIHRMSIGGDTTTDLKRSRDLKEARDAYKKGGSGTGRIIKSDNIYWNNAGRLEREMQDSMTSQQVEATIQFFRDKMRRILQEGMMRSV